MAGALRALLLRLGGALALIVGGAMNALAGDPATCPHTPDPAPPACSALYAASGSGTFCFPTLDRCGQPLGIRRNVGGTLHDNTLRGCDFIETFPTSFGAYTRFDAPLPGARLPVAVCARAGRATGYASCWNDLGKTTATAVYDCAAVGRPSAPVTVP